jgi:Bacterial Ig-like domain (group 3)
MNIFWRAIARVAKPSAHLVGALAIAGLAGVTAQIAGGQPAGAAGPYASGTIFVADQNCGAVDPYPGPGCIWEIPPGGYPEEFAYGSENPQDVAIDAAGDLFWTESSDSAVRELNASGTEIILATSYVPWGIASDGTHVWFGAFGGSNGEGIYEVPAGVANSTPTFVTGAFGVATSLAVDGNGDLWGAGSSGQLFVVPAGSTTGFSLSLPSPAESVTGVRVDAANDVYVSDGYGDTAAELQPATGSVTPFGSGLNYTKGVAVDTNGDVFVGQPSGVPGYGKIYKISGGSQSLYASGQMATTGGIAYWPPPVPAVRKAATVTLSTTSASTVSTEAKVTVTATVSPAVSGRVQFERNGQPVGGLVTLKSGVAHLTTTLPAGADTITAGFVGNTTRAPALGNSLAFTATPVASKTSISTSSTTVAGNSDARVTATVTGHGGTPTGYVEFYDGTQSVAEGNLTGGTTTVNFPLHVGTSKVHAVYEGDSTFATSNSNKLTFTTVPPYRPTLEASVRYSKVPSGKEKTATVTVHVTGVKNNGAPTGTVTAGQGFTCGALTPAATGLTSTAVCTAVIPYGTDEYVTITYSGSATYQATGTSVYVYNGDGDD